MNISYSQAFIAQLQGDDLESAYAKKFGGAVIGGIGDGGLDIRTNDNRVPYVQIKSSLKGLQDFLAKALRFKKFIPVCLGEPGDREEMYKHLLEFGVWVGSEIPGRQRILTAVSQIRHMCTVK
jgi:hypothetical protein